jgi:hypothetical protein
MSPQRASSLFSPKAVMAFFGDKLFLADRCTQIRENGCVAVRDGSPGNALLPVERYEGFTVGGEHRDGVKQSCAGVAKAGEWRGGQGGQGL